MALKSIEVTQGQRMRWRRSAWHRLLIAIDAQARTGPVPTTALLGVDEARLKRWLDADEAMSTPRQWQLVYIGEGYCHDDAPLVRAARALRVQLEATAAFVSRGPPHTMLTPEGMRATRS